jgi:hypothetical protein
VAAFKRARSLAGTKPARSAAALAARYVAARATSVVTLVVAAWFFTLEAFAAFGVYASLANLAWAGIFLRYENAVIAAPGEEEARAAVRLCAVVGTGLWATLSLLALASIGLGLFPVRLVLFFPLALAGRAALRLAMAAATRGGDFRELGRAVLVQSATQPFVLLALAVALADGALCLVIADAVGHGLAAAYLWARQRDLVLGSLGPRWSRREIVRTAQHWASLPILNLPGALLGMAFAASPLLVMPLVASPAVAGAVALAIRLFDVPTQIVIAATAPVMMNRLRATDDATAPVFGRRLMAGFSGLIGIAYAGFAGAFLLALPWLKGTIFESLAPVVWPVAIFQGALAAAGPLAEACALYRRQTALTLIHLATLASSGLGLLAASAAGPMAGLAVLALAAAARAVAIGERLRALSLDARRETDRIQIEALP